MAKVFDNNSQTGTLPYRREDSDGRVWWKVTAHDSLTANTPYAIQPGGSGYVSAALVDSGYMFRVGVPDAAAVTDAVVWLQTGGLKESMVTASIAATENQYLKIDNAAVAASTTTWNTSTFAVCTETAAAATTIDVLLIDREIYGED